MPELNYEQIYQQARTEYDAEVAKFYEITGTREYIEGAYAAPFEFLRALYLSKRIELFCEAEEGKKPHFTFSSIQEAISTYKDIMLYKRNIADLLNKATVIVQASDQYDKINNMVVLSNYLEDSLVLKVDEKIFGIAKDCVKELPKTARLVTADLRNHFLLDVLTFIKEGEGLNLLCQKGMFKKTDLDNLLKISSTNEQLAAIDNLYKVFGLSNAPLISTFVRLKGVTFVNEDGTSRQDNLKALDKYVNETHERPALLVIPFTYTPEVGDPEPAARILWGTKELGFLPKDVAIDLSDKYKDKVYRASVRNVTGGNGVSYGLDIVLDIHEPAVVEEKAQEAMTR